MTEGKRGNTCVYCSLNCVYIHKEKSSIVFITVGGDTETGRYINGFGLVSVTSNFIIRNSSTAWIEEVIFEILKGISELTPNAP